ncbi:MAG TPA: hypothetical protein VHS05_13920 [Pyrinomonadaceae bacterium]|nr:hypothetical protein [Pyrinomonadaceae bacterium]
MNKTRINDPFRNPFHNKFHVPVHSRLDEMQSYTHLVRLDDASGSVEKTDGTEKSRVWIGALAGAFGLVLLVVLSARFFV